MLTGWVGLDKQPAPLVPSTHTPCSELSVCQKVRLASRGDVRPY